MTNKTLKKALPKNQSQDQEQSLADNLQLISLIKDNPDFLHRNPELLKDIQVPHSEHGTVSLIERQVEQLRNKLKSADSRLCELMDIARDNERLAQSRQRIAINLLGARDLEDVITTVLDELSNELDAEIPVLKLITKDERLLHDRNELFVDGEGMEAFTIMLQQQNPVCGRSTEEQKRFLFGDDADKVASTAIIPLIAGANLGLIGLGSSDARRFHSVMGTEFLSQLGELVSAALAVHLETE